MNVLIDIEWVKENEGSSITQFAAVRVSEDWKTVAAFECLVCPGNLGNIDWGNMAYNGYPPEEFQRGVSEKVCISDFIGFLDDCDTILCWHGDTKHLLKQKVVQFLGKPLPVKCKCVNHAVYAIAQSKGIMAYGLYEVAEKNGIITPEPKHRSTNDVIVLQKLLSAFGYDKKEKRKAMPDAPKSRADRRERNADILSRTEYHYIC